MNYEFKELSLPLPYKLSSMPSMPHDAVVLWGMETGRLKGAWAETACQLKCHFTVFQLPIDTKYHTKPPTTSPFVVTMMMTPGIVSY